MSHPIAKTELSTFIINDKTHIAIKNGNDSLKLFKQIKFNNWDHIINDIYDQLKNLIRQLQAHRFKINVKK
mgnify:CR=1 FL=1